MINKRSNFCGQRENFYYTSGIKKKIVKNQRIKGENQKKIADL